MKPRTIQLLLVIMLAAASCLAETGYVTIQVEDAQGHPVRNIEIGLDGIGGSHLTGDDGKAQVAVGKDTAPGDWITLHILHSPAGKDFVINSPWDYRSQVPPFANKPENFIKIIVVQRGDRAALEVGTVLASLAAKINKANAPQTASQQTPATDPKEALTTVAKQYDLSANDVDAAIRAWGLKTTDPYEAGLAALYARNFAKATSALKDSLQQREQKLEADQKSSAQDRNGVVEAAFFLGQSLFQEGRYREAVPAYQKCLEYRPDDSTLLNNLALSLIYAGDYAAAEPLLQRALAINEKTFGPDHPEVATDLNNLALLLEDKGDYAGAEPLYRRSLAINEKTFGPDNPEVARELNNLAVLLREKGDLAGAEPLFRRSLAIDEKALGPDSPEVAIRLNNLASLLHEKGNLTDSEPLFRSAIAINEKVLGPDHPEVAKDLNNLALLLEDKGEYDEAEPLVRRSLAIDEKSLGPDHPEVATELNNLSWILRHKGDLAGAESLLRQAIAINEKAYGPEHFTVGKNLDNLAQLLEQRGDYTGAEPLFRRALAIDEKALGPNHPEVARELNNLAWLLQHKGDPAEAEPLYRRALAIAENTFGPDNPTTRTIRDNLTKLQNQPATAHQ